MPIFYSALMLTGVNLLLRLVGTSFQVYISGRIGAAGIGLLQLVLSVGSLSMTAGIAGIRTATMYLTAEMCLGFSPVPICTVSCAAARLARWYTYSPPPLQKNGSVTPAPLTRSGFWPRSCLSAVCAVS